MSRLRSNTYLPIGPYAALQSISEIGLGSVIHSAHIPLGGHALSLNQGFLLTLACRNVQSRRDGASLATGISTVAAILKVLSPAGKRLPPMLAISVQGMLFAFGIALAGANVIGAALGLILLSLWAFVQPLLLAYVLFGKPFFEAIRKLWVEATDWLGIPEQWGLWILGALVALKLVLAVVIAGGAWFFGDKIEERYVARVRKRWRSETLSNRLESKDAKGAFRGSLRDLVNPWFLISLGLSLGFIVLTGTQSVSEKWFYALRTLAIAWLFFWALRSVPFSKIEPKLKKFPHVQAALREILKSE